MLATVWKEREDKKEYKGKAAENREQKVEIVSAFCRRA